MRVHFKAPWRRGAAFADMSVDTFLSRLCALVPPPRFHMTRYYGVFASHHRLRARVIPSSPQPPAPTQLSLVFAPGLPGELREAASTPRRVGWASLLARVFAVDVTVCASYRGPLAGGEIDVASEFRDRSGMSPLDAKHDDIFVKMLTVRRKLRSTRREQVVRIGGCPVSVAEQVLALVQLGKLPNPYLDPKLAPAFVSAYFSWRTRALVQRVFGQPYNQPGPALRGAARPLQNLPPAAGGD